MRLTGKQFAGLQAAIAAAFTRDELRLLLKVDLDTSLEAITPDKGFEAQVFDLLLWLERHGRLLEFVERARTANPANEELAAACTTIRQLGVQRGSGDLSHNLGLAGNLAAILGIDWVAIPEGVLRIGSDAEQDMWAQVSEMPQHDVVVPQFLIARCPITNYQYQVFVLATEYAPPPHWRSGTFPDTKHNHPVVNVSWYDAMAFCRWANVRLPSEAQWEWAARGPDNRLWPWGNEPPTPLRCNFALKIANTTPVTLFLSGASAHGVLDMAGNVWEWTSSLWLPYPYNGEEEPKTQEGNGLRVVRGGSYDSPARQIRCAYRSAINPYYGYDDVGIRVVLYNPAASIPLESDHHA
jgi:formylglycine-generating enzyme required for sulfatase activity